MYPYLVGPARHRDAGREAQAVFGFQYGIFRPAGFAIGGDAPPDDALPLPPDGGVDDAVIGCDSADGNGAVFAP